MIKKIKNNIKKRKEYMDKLYINNPLKWNKIRRKNEWTVRILLMFIGLSLVFIVYFFMSNARLSVHESYKNECLTLNNGIEDNTTFLCCYGCKLYKHETFQYLKDIDACYCDNTRELWGAKTYNTINDIKYNFTKGD